MGTSAVATVIRNGEILANIHVTSDGYLDGFGDTLLSVLKRKHVNGYQNEDLEYNGVGNFIALVIAKCVISKTESTKRVNEYFKKPEPKDLSCGLVSVVNKFDDKWLDYHYTIKFDCSLERPLPPLIKVKSHGFESAYLGVDEFDELVHNGIPSDEDE